MKIVKVRKSSSSSSILNVKVCDTFLSRFVGLMFSKELRPDAGVILVEKDESRVNTSIHMFFMNYDITALWLDKNMVVVDKVLAKKWRPFYIPQKPAQFILELHQSKFPEFAIGDKFVMIGEDQ